MNPCRGTGRKFSNNANSAYTLEVRGALYMVGQPGLPITFVGDTTGTKRKIHMER
nr:hypothetical protein [Bacteroidota bacterium]